MTELCKLVSNSTSQISNGQHVSQFDKYERHKQRNLPENDGWLAWAGGGRGGFDEWRRFPATPSRHEVRFSVCWWAVMMINDLNGGDDAQCSLSEEASSFRMSCTSDLGAWSWISLRVAQCSSSCAILLLITERSLLPIAGACRAGGDRTALLHCKEA